MPAIAKTKENGLCEGDAKLEIAKTNFIALHIRDAKLADTKKKSGCTKKVCTNSNVKSKKCPDGGSGFI